MGKKKRDRRRLTIEGQLEKYYQNESHTERNGVLWHAWCQNKRWLSQLLETTMSSFPTYSKHDESHANTVLHNIEMILGEERIRELSASDCFMLLHTVYIHDIGMVITHTDRENIVKNDRFLDMVNELSDDSDAVFQKAIKALQQTKYEYDDEDSKEDQMKRLYSDKLSVYYAVLHLIANFRRPEHGELSEDRLSKWTLESEKLGAGFSMAGIPQRIFLLIAKCAGLHTDSDFENIMKLPQEDNGYVSDYLHPRFVAVLLQLGDILDMDNDRFHPLTKEFVGVFPEISERHYEKHQSIRRLYIRPDIISIEADCVTQDALRLVRKECDILKNILKEAGYNWMLICPRNFSGALPTVDSVKLYLNGMQIPEELVATQFHISQSKAFAILEGSNVYKGQYVFLREFLQNAIDATKIQYWQECVRTRGYYSSKDELKRMAPDEMSDILSTDIFPIEIEMQIVKANEKREYFIITEEDIDNLRNKKERDKWQYGVKVRVKDFGTGIDKESILNIAKVGNSRKRERHIIRDMPEWLKPMAEFGIGLQSAFILTNMFKCYTYTRSNEKYEVTFSTVKSNYYEGYINVQPKESFQTKDDAYGACFEVFVPVQKKMVHELYPAAWDGKDYFDEDYETLRPLRHSAELLAQMALYLDGQIGEQFFPIHLKVESDPRIVIPLNRSEKNRLKKLKCNLKAEKSLHDDIMEMASSYQLAESRIKLVQNIFVNRKWEESGKSWIFYYKEIDKTDHFENENYGRNILVEKTDHSIALLDLLHSCLYFWDNNLCTFCTINIKNFLLREKAENEKGDLNCDGKNIKGSVIIYYKGIELDEMELPDFGNELIQSIDIKGKLDREYINLSRKGFTEKGQAYFIHQIYEPLLESVHEILRAMNKNQPQDVVDSVKNNLHQNRKLIDFLSRIIKECAGMTLRKEIGRAFLPKSIFERMELKHCAEMVREEAVDLCKESILLVTMLAFFAQKGEFNPLFRLSCEDDMQTVCCWNDTLECIRKYGGWLKKELSSRSVLFKIEHRPEVNLEKGIAAGNARGIISFPDVLSKEYRFMIVSKRENAFAPWKQFLTPIYIKKDIKDHEDPIDILKQYVLTDSFSNKKKELEERIQRIGKNALNIAEYYDKGDAGTVGEMNPGEYLQQYFLTWMLKYIPTVALFMSEDGNTRVNIIHGKTLPFVFVNQSYKVSVLERILENSEKYGIQRFSIPAWQKMEYIKCKELPYSHFFIKRGYMAKESYGKMIFPFGKNQIKIISEKMYSVEAGKNADMLLQLFKVLNVQGYLRECLDLDQRNLDRQIDSIHAQSDNTSVDYTEVYKMFKESWQKGERHVDSVMEEIRDEYRAFTVSCIQQYKKSEEESEARHTFQLGNVKAFSEKCCHIIACILLKVLAMYNTDNFFKMGDLPLKYDPEFADGWMYIIGKKYMTDASEVAKYKQDYLNMLKSEKSNEFLKQQMILNYIAKHTASGLSSDNLWNCWKRCLEEMFDIFIMIEMRNFINPQNLLPDLKYIETRI